MTKTEKNRKTIWLTSLIVFGLSLFSPTYCTNVKCSEPLSGFLDLLFGWFAALFMGSTYFAWFANPFFITAIFTNKKSPVLSLIFSIIAFAIGLTFLKGGQVLLNEAGHKGYITKLHIGYWLWITSMAVMIVASLLPIIKNKKTFRKKDLNSN